MAPRIEGAFSRAGGPCAWGLAGEGDDLVDGGVAPAIPDVGLLEFAVGGADAVAHVVLGLALFAAEHFLHAGHVLVGDGGALNEVADVFVVGGVEDGDGDGLELAVVLLVEELLDDVGVVVALEEAGFPAGASGG